MATGPSMIGLPSVKSRLLSGSTWALTVRVLAVMAAMIVNALLARLLDPGDMGAYYLALSMVSGAAIVAQMGLGQTAVRLIAESLGTGRPWRACATVRTVFLYGACSVLIVTGFLALGGWQWLVGWVFNAPLLAGIAGCAVIWIATNSVQSLIAESFRGFSDIRLAATFGLLFVRILSILLLSLLWIARGTADLRQVLWYIIAAGIVSVIISGFLLRRKVHKLQYSQHLLSTKEVFPIALPLMVALLARFVRGQVDLWITGAFLPQEEVALYGAAVRVVTLVGTSLVIVNAVLPPLVAELYSQGKKQALQRMLQTVAAIAGIPAFLGLLLLVLFGGPILGLIFGEYYRGGASVLLLLSLGSLASVLAGSCGIALMMTNNQAAMMRISLFSASLVVIGGLALVRGYGVVGVAAASAGATIVQNLLMLIYARRRVGVWTYARFDRGFLKKQLFPGC